MLGADSRGRSRGRAWVWEGLAAVGPAGGRTARPATVAVCLGASAVVVDWRRRDQALVPGWCLLGLAVLAVMVWGPDVIALWFEHGAAVALLTLASLSILTHVRRSWALSQQLQHRADALDDQQLLALLPDDAAQLAKQWRAGDDRHAPELAVVMHLAVMHAALAPRMRGQGMLAG